jgi:uncharacterized protein YodC (DUF2158 family)
MMRFNIGDIVQLKSGGPQMTVQRIIGMSDANFMIRAADEFLKTQGFTEGDVVCQWFNDNRLESGTFKQESLKSID